MDFFTAINVSSSGLSAQRTRLNVASSNLANVETTRTAEGGPFRRRQVIHGYPITSGPRKRPCSVERA